MFTKSQWRILERNQRRDVCAWCVKVITSARRKSVFMVRTKIRKRSVFVLSLSSNILCILGLCLCSSTSPDDVEVVVKLTDIQKLVIRFPDICFKKYSLALQIVWKLPLHLLLFRKLLLNFVYNFIYFEISSSNCIVIQSSWSKFVTTTQSTWSLGIISQIKLAIDDFVWYSSMSDGTFRFLFFSCHILWL